MTTAFLSTRRITFTTMTITRKIEKHLILSDAIICAALKVEADAIGSTIEEYVDRFLAVYYKEPDRFYTYLNDKSKND